MKVLFIGATGNVGSRAVPALRAEHEVIAAAVGGGEVGGQAVHNLDITDFEAVLKLVSETQADALVNCAIADYRGSSSNLPPEQRHDYFNSTIEVNVRGAYHLYEAARRFGVPKVVFISSMTTILGEPRYQTVHGDDPPHPVDFYACTKLFGEQLGRVYGTQHGLSVTCLRLANPCPLNTDVEKRLYSNPAAHGRLVHFDDITAAIRGALVQEGPFHTYAIASDAATPFVVPTAIPELNYVPAYYASHDGMHRKPPAHS